MNDETSVIFCSTNLLLSIVVTFFEYHILSNSGIAYEIASEQFDLIILSGDTPARHKRWSRKKILFHEFSN
jgi:hypothetical protein